jgi:hypothetical protein
MRATLCVSLLMMVAACSPSGASQGKCQPDCAEKSCGDDGCGGSCGSCDDGIECTNDSCSKGTCLHVVQEVYCEISGACAPSGTVNPSNSCQSCQPANAKAGWSALDDGISCGLGKVCHDGSCCDAAANCVGKECGSDSCGGTCGDCPPEGTCVKGLCDVPCHECTEGTIRCVGEDQWAACTLVDDCWVWPAAMTPCPPSQQCVCLTTADGESCQPVAGEECVCVPDCSGKDCGADGCGGSCGQCSGVNVVCQAGHCGCAGPLCGDACCASYQVCTDGLTCCNPACDGKECGEDGCGGVCGTCPGGDWVSCVLGTCVCQGTVCPKACCANSQICDAGGNCCDEQCDGKECGANGCGGVCGLCEPGQMCMNGLCPPPGKECIDGNDTDWDGCTDFELTEFVVNASTADWQIEPQVAALATGGHVVVWASKAQDGDLTGVFGQRFADDGAALGVEFQVNTVWDDHQEHPAVAALAGGGFVVVYESWGLDGSGDAIAAQVFGADGSKVSSELVVNQVTAADQANPAVTATDKGGFLVVWDGADMAVDWNGIYARAFDAQGVPQGDQFGLNLETVGVQQFPAVTTLEDGHLVAAWQSDGDGESNAWIQGVIFGDDGSVVAKEATWNVFTAGEQTQVDLAPLGAGFVALWQSEGQDNSGAGVVVATFDANGANLVAPALANETALGDQRLPTVAGLVGGGVVQAWASKDQDGSDYGVVFRQVDAQGVAGGEVVANVYVASIQDRPSLAPLPEGGFFLVWQGWEQGGDGYDILGARFDASGNRLYH